jgi:uncharacterized protein YhfF
MWFLRSVILAKMATELVALVVNGTKAATASLQRDFTDAGAPVPCPGDFSMVLDRQGTPQCVLRTTEVAVKPLLRSMLASLGTRLKGIALAREWWLDAHRRYFGRQALRWGFAIDDTPETVFERFEVV